MKKILCLALALLMIVVMATACKKDKDNGNANGSNTTPNYVSPEGTQGGVYEDTNAIVEETDATLVECEQEVVYVVNAPNGLNLRNNMSISGAAASWVKEGTALYRIAKGDVWSKVVYEGKEYYAKSTYLSTSKDGGENITIVFEEIDDVVYVSESAANYRTTPDLSKSTAGSLAFGTQIKRTGVMYEPVDPVENPNGAYGWSRVEIEGKTYYMRNSVLTTIAPIVE